MNQILSHRIAKIKKVIDTATLSEKQQDISQVKDYYDKNKLPYRIFHNFSGYLHMGISDGAEYDKKDLVVALNQIDIAIKEHQYFDIVELGSGRGANAYYLAFKNPSAHITAMDLSTGPLVKYKKLKNLQFIKGDYHELKFLKDQSVDLVFGIETFCHSDDKNKLFAEIYRILKPNGTLYIFDGYRTSNLYADKDIEFAAVLVEHGMAVNKFETLTDLETKAISVGFDLEDKLNLSKNVLPTMKRFEKMALKFFNHSTLARIASTFLPEKFIRNSVAGYLMVPLVKQGAVVYYKHVFSKKVPT